jgi:hypothetical protein
MCYMKHRKTGNNKYWRRIPILNCIDYLWILSGCEYVVLITTRTSSEVDLAMLLIWGVPVSKSNPLTFYPDWNLPIYPQFNQTIAGGVFYVKSQSLSSTFFPAHYSLIILSLDENVMDFIFVFVKRTANNWTNDCLENKQINYLPWRFTCRDGKIKSFISVFLLLLFNA